MVYILNWLQKYFMTSLNKDMLLLLFYFIGMNDRFSK